MVASRPGAIDQGFSDAVQLGQGTADQPWGPVCASEQVTQRLVVGRVGVGAQVALPTDPCQADQTGLLESGGLSCDPAGMLNELAQCWWSTRVDPDWRPRPPAESQRILDELGLTGEFWRLG